MQPHITIVMATRNGARHLQDQLDSIHAQTHQNWSLFVSDDGSCDATSAILHEFARHHPVTVVSGPKRGAAVNFLSALSHPQLGTGWVALADQDDVWLPGKLARATRRITARLAQREADRTAVLYGSESILTNAQLRPVSISRADSQAPSFARSLVQNLFAGHSMVMTPAAHQMLRAAGVPRNVHWHDWWIYQYLAAAGAELVLDPLPTTLYRQHSHNALGGAHGLMAKLHRITMVFNGEWGRMMEDHITALSKRSNQLSPAAIETLTLWKSAPKWGLKRARSLDALGLHRARARETLLLRTSAMIGRL